MPSMIGVGIIFPMILITIFNFMFVVSTQVLDSKLFLLNCPYPIQAGIAQSVQILGTNGLPAPKGYIITYVVNYTGTSSPSNSTQGTFFNCTIDGVTGNHQVNTIIKSYGMVQFGIPIGQITFFADTVGVFFGKIGLVIQIMFLGFTAPSQISGLSWFLYVNVILVVWIILGVVALVRGGG